MQEFSRRAKPGSDFDRIRAESSRWISEYARHVKGTPQEEALGLLKSLPEQLGDWGVITSVAFDGISLHVDVIDRRRDFRLADHGMYAGARITMTAHSRHCPPGYIEVKHRVRVWIQTCTNGAGYWNEVDDGFVCVPADDRLPMPGILFGRTAAGGGSGGDPRPDGPNEQPGRVPDPSEWDNSAELNGLLFALYECTTRELSDLGVAMEAIEAEFRLSRTVMNSITGCFLDEPGITEFHVVMAVSAAANDESLTVSDRLRLDQVTSDLLRDGIRQCRQCSSCFVPSPHMRQRRNWRPEDVPPEQLLDTINALLAPYTGGEEDPSLFQRSPVRDLPWVIKHGVVDQRFQALLREAGLPQELVDAVPVYDPTRSADDHAREAREATGQASEARTHHIHLNAAIAALGEGDTQAAIGYLDNAEQQTPDTPSRDMWLRQISLIRDNMEGIARALATINAEHRQNWVLWNRIAGNPMGQA